MAALIGTRLLAAGGKLARKEREGARERELERERALGAGAALAPAPTRRRAPPAGPEGVRVGAEDSRQGSSSLIK